MAKVQRKQRTCKLRGNMSFKLTTTVTAVHKCIYPGSQWSSLVWDPQKEQVIIVLFKAGAILIRYRRRWSMSWARNTRRRGRCRQDQLVVLRVETSKLYTPQPTSTIRLVRASFVLHDFCCPSIVRFTLASNTLNHLHEHKYFFGLINFVNTLILTNVMKCQ